MKLKLAVEIDPILIQRLLDDYAKDAYTLERTQIELGSCRSQLRTQEYRQIQIATT